MEDDEDQYSYLVEWNKNHPIDYVRTGLWITISIICALLVVGA